MKILTHLLTCICLLGNTMHLYWLSYKYFQYEVSSSVTVEYPEMITPPSVSIRLSAYRLLNWTTMTTEMKRRILACNNSMGLYGDWWNPCGEGRKNGTLIYVGELDEKQLPKFNESSLRQLLQVNRTYRTSRQFYRGLYITTNLIAVNQTQLLNLTVRYNPTERYRRQFLRIYFLALRGHSINPEKEKKVKTNTSLKDRESLEMRLGYRPSIVKRFDFYPVAENATVNYFAVRSLAQGQLYNVDFNRKLIELRGIKVATLKLCPFGFNCDFGLSKDIRLNLTGTSHKMIVTYDEYRNSLLPHPYTTKCRDYQKEGLSDRDNCYLSCIKVTDERNFQKYVFNRTLVNCRRECYPNASRCAQLSKKMRLNRRLYYKQFSRNCTKVAGERNFQKYVFNRTLVNRTRECYPNASHCVQLAKKMRGNRLYYKQLLNKQNCTKVLRRCKCLRNISPTYRTFKRVQANCTRSCQQPSCSDVIIISRVVSGDGYDIYIYAPSTPIITTVATEQISLITFLTNIASSLGFWLGFSAVASTYSIFRYLPIVFKWITCRRKKKTPKNSCSMQHNLLLERKVHLLENELHETRYLLSYQIRQLRNHDKPYQWVRTR